MDYRKKVFEMLGVEPWEGFKIKKDGKVREEEFFIGDNLEFGCDIPTKITIYDIFDGTAEIVKSPKPTKEEKIALEYARACGFNWISKDEDGKVFAYKEKPIKGEIVWRPLTEMYVRIWPQISFIHWEDDEPYYIGNGEP